ncbi:anaerobic ribonucleoside-triphosphate reductase activating protein [Roseateles sp. LKC17W]|uniref:Anaerobic ribonucleoside-triphosphate reductase activating protein n=1 Tax=Pelomonas margarita TaxID=3299031 RepID=A0ABW7FFZ1_9BURK
MPAGLSRLAPGVPAAQLAVAGLQPFSTVDFPGQLAAVVFLQGCPWRCAYCHNPELQARGPGDGPRWPALRAWLQGRAGRLDGVVFSGGEPSTDPALPAALAELRAMGYRLGLHSAGLAPGRLARLLPLLDWVGLDVKAAPADAALHERLTGAPGGARRVRESLALLQASGVAYELRSTVHPQWFRDADVLRLVEALRDASHHVLQVARLPGPDGRPQLPPGYPSAALLAAARALRPGLQVRA